MDRFEASDDYVLYKKIFFIKSELRRSPAGTFTITFDILLIFLLVGFDILAKSQAMSWSENLIEQP